MLPDLAGLDDARAIMPEIWAGAGREAARRAAQAAPS